MDKPKKSCPVNVANTVIKSYYTSSLHNVLLPVTIFSHIRIIREFDTLNEIYTSFHLQFKSIYDLNLYGHFHLTFGIFILGYMISLQCTRHCMVGCLYPFTLLPRAIGRCGREYYLYNYSAMKFRVYCLHLH